MPELPEVETIARGLDKRIAGDIIESVWLGAKPEPLKSSPQEIASVLEHSRIVHVRRVGKHIVFDLEGSGTHVSKTHDANMGHPGCERTQTWGTRAQTSGAADLAGSETRVHGAVDCSSRHDRAVADRSARSGDAEAHACRAEAQVGTRAALRRLSPLRTIGCRAHDDRSRTRVSPLPAPSRSTSRSKISFRSFMAARRRSRARC